MRLKNKHSEYRFSLLLFTLAQLTVIALQLKCKQNNEQDGFYLFTFLLIRLTLKQGGWSLKPQHHNDDIKRGNTSMDTTC